MLGLIQYDMRIERVQDEYRAGLYENQWCNCCIGGWWQLISCCCQVHVHRDCLFKQLISCCSLVSIKYLVWISIISLSRRSKFLQYGKIFAIIDQGTMHWRVRWCQSPEMNQKRIANIVNFEIKVKWFEIVVREQETWNIFFVLWSSFRFVCHISN